MLKRVLLCLALALALCFGLCACDSELTQEQLEILQGTWFNERAFTGGRALNDIIPYLIELSTDGTCSFDGEGGMTWEARHNKKTENLEVKIFQNKNVIFLFTIKPLNKNGTNGYQSFLTDENGNVQFGIFVRSGSAEPYADWIDKISSEWYPIGNGITPLPLTIHADGTCSVDGKPYRWTFSPDNNTDENTGFDAFVYANRKTHYRFRAEFNTINKTVQVKLYKRGSLMSDYAFHPLKSTLVPASWIAFDHDNTVAPEVLTAHEHIHFGISPGNGKNFSWEISDSTTDKKLVICVPDAAAPQYIVSMYMNGEYPQMEIEVKETGETFFYYQYHKGYDPANPEAPNKDA